MLMASAIAVLDGLAGRDVMLIGLLAIPPVIAAMSASLPETGVVGAFCLALAVLSILWHQNLDVAAVCGLALDRDRRLPGGPLGGEPSRQPESRAGCLRAARRSGRPDGGRARPEGASPASRRSRRPVARRRRADRHGHARGLDRANGRAGPQRRGRRHLRQAARRHADRSPRPPPRRGGDPHRPDEVPGPPLRSGDRRHHDPRERARAPPQASVQVLHRAAARRPRIGSRRHDPVDHASHQGLRRDGQAHREAARGSGRPRARQRPSARAAGSHRLGPPAQPAAAIAAGDQGLRGLLALPGRRRGIRGRRGLLRRLSQRRGQLDRGDRRRLRQGP